jgi:hypothetical protein
MFLTLGRSDERGQRDSLLLITSVTAKEERMGKGKGAQESNS